MPDQRAGDTEFRVITERDIENLTTSQRVAVRAIAALHPDDVRFAMKWMDEWRCAFGDHLHTCETPSEAIETPEWEAGIWG